jgi:hypothetical protein
MIEKWQKVKLWPYQRSFTEAASISRLFLSMALRFAFPLMRQRAITHISGDGRSSHAAATARHVAAESNSQPIDFDVAGKIVETENNNRLLRLVLAPGGGLRKLKSALC